MPGSSNLTVSPKLPWGFGGPRTGVLIKLAWVIIAIILLCDYCERFLGARSGVSPGVVILSRTVI